MTNPNTIGRYQIIKLLGKGGMGSVYEAFDPNIGRPVAIKTILVDGLSAQQTEELQARFLSEGRAAGILHHDNIIRVFDADRDQGTAYLVMELIQGDDLSKLLKNGKPLALDNVFSIMRGLLAALDHAHTKGIIHRDIKPANLLIDAGGNVKLGDFGVARIVGNADAHLTSFGNPIGTYRYMSPEQMLMEPVDARTDLWAAGVILYQLLTGRPPFDGSNTTAVILAVQRDTPPAVSTLNPIVPHELDEVVYKSLAKQAAQRYSSAREFMMALRNVAQSTSSGNTQNPASSRGTAPAQPSLGSSAPAGPAATPAPATSQVKQEMELAYWKSIESSTDPDDFTDFLQEFPQGPFSGLARRRLKRLVVAPGDGETTSNSPTRPDATGSTQIPSGDSEFRDRSFAAPAPQPSHDDGDQDKTQHASRADIETARAAAAQRIAQDKAVAEKAASEKAAAEQVAAAKAAAERAATERVALERAAIEKAAAQKAAAEKAAAEQVAAAKAALERSAAEKVAALKAAADKAAADKAAADKAAADKAAADKAAADKAAADKAAAAQQTSAERLASEKAAAEKAAAEKLATEKAAAQRAAAERLAAEKAAADKAAAEKVAAEKLATEKAAAQRAAAERLAAEKAAADKAAAEKAAAEKMAAEKAAAQRAAAERLAAEKAAAHKAAAENAAAEKMAAEKAAAQRAAAERQAAEKAAADKAAAEKAAAARLAAEKAAAQHVATERPAASAAPAPVAPKNKLLVPLIGVAVVAVAVGGYLALKPASPPVPTPTGRTEPAAGPTATTAPTQETTAAPEQPAATAAPQPNLSTPATPTSPSPNDASKPLDQAGKLEAKDMDAAVKLYEQIAASSDKQQAAGAAKRLFELYTSGKGRIARDPAKALVWYQRAKQLGVPLPTLPEAGDKGTVSSPLPPTQTPAPVPPQSLPVPTPAPIPTPAPEKAPVPVPVPAPTPTPQPTAAAPTAPKSKTNDELFTEAAALEKTSMRRAIATYEIAANKGHGPSQKRLWQILPGEGRPQDAAMWQRKAFENKVEGVQEPKVLILNK